MNRIRVLVVDDSVVIRQIISDALKTDPEIEVVALAPNGRVALEKIPQCKPDLITLDLEMPEMDGLTLLEELRKRSIKVPVVVFSTLTERGAKATLEALTRGASDYVCKPSGQRSVQATLERIRAELIPKLHGLTKRKRPVAAAAALGGLPLPAARASASIPPERCDAIVIGVSTGGPSALAEVIPKLPRELGVPIMIVQHMPPVFTQVLAQRLAGASQLKVREATHRERIEPGVVYIAPGDHHMRIAGSAREGWLTLDQQPAENGCRPSVDPLFASAAPVYGKNLLALILTGVGHDGTKGAQHVRRAGGTVWAQDEASSTAWGMPSSVIDAALAQRVLPLHQVARAIVEAVLGNRPVSHGPRRAP
ncbi:MAG TPA: chemotaxis response regulator protein-glutamate methylesterase [Polyangiales bacterium]|nr:chemotaxis response regulator protein-glutamate methylesterase [Polyangiales bacterium]